MKGAVPEVEWPEEFAADIQANWQSPFGDCHQELVYIGQNIDAEKACNELDLCLLSDDELSAGETEWKTYRDNFPTCLADEHV